ncbi:MAG TPA: hypothetical protein VLL76_05485 [Candidatus Omnitrophota bacterium]|nr:hypothetical protein [Candidatus Omnitrophota bacterium]
MRAETILFLPQGDGYRITDEFRDRTYGTITPQVVEKPGRRPSRRFHVVVDLGGGIDTQADYMDLDEAQERAEAFIRAHGTLG